MQFIIETLYIYLYLRSWQKGDGQTAIKQTQSIIILLFPAPAELLIFKLAALTALPEWTWKLLEVPFNIFTLKCSPLDPCEVFGIEVRD